jgi:hypothetical protein
MGILVSVTRQKSSSLSAVSEVFTIVAIDKWQTTVESQRKPSELIFVVLNFVIAAQSRGAVLRKRLCNRYALSISLDIRATSARNLSK